MQKSLSDLISKQTVLEDLFRSLSRQDREAAYKVVRARIGAKTISLKDLLEAHRQIKEIHT